MRRLAAERRAHEQQRYEEERIAAVLTSPIFWKGIVKRMTPMHTWVKVEGRWRSRTLT